MAPELSGSHMPDLPPNLGILRSLKRRAFTPLLMCTEMSFDVFKALCKTVTMQIWQTLAQNCRILLMHTTLQTA